jgi:sugar-specific transcriptional regulator TrmB
MIEKLFLKYGMTEYQIRALLTLIRHGEAKASDISELSGIPKAKVYSVLDQLVNFGLIEKIPERPVRYRSKPPEELVGRLKYNLMAEYSNRLKAIEEVEEELVTNLKHLYAPVGINYRDLIRILSVGEASERETKLFYQEAREEIDIISKSFEYYPKVRREIIEASRRGVKIKVLLLGEKFLNERSKSVQREILKLLQRETNAKVRLSKTLLPLRGTIIDPSYEYKTGKAIFVVEDPKTPLYLRDAAVTENPSLVAGMKKYFDLIWEYEAENLDA